MVNALRIHTAAAQMREGTRTLEEISQDVGINGARYFCQLFKKYYAMTPSAYKRTPCLPVDGRLAYLIESMQNTMREGR